MAAFNKRRAPTSRKYICEIINVSDFLVALLRFGFRKQPKSLNFNSFFLALIDPLLATFNETRAPTSRKYVSEQGIVMLN